MRLVLPLVLLMVAAAAPARAADTGPALSVKAEDLAAALQCPADLSGSTRAPVLLVPGTNLEARSNFDWNYMPALDQAGIRWCAVTLPRFAMSDAQISAEYVVYAIRQMRAKAGRKVSVVGFSQGGMLGRWALKYWPDTREAVEDLVGLAPSNHGTASSRAICVTSCPPSYWQQRDNAKFIAALNTGPETWAGIDYTVAYTRYDEVVSPNADEATGSSSLRTGAGRIENVALQELCPNNGAEHLALGSYDPVGWAIAIDALNRPGPVDPARIDRGVCNQGAMPGVNPATFAADYARYTATVAQGSAQSEYVPAEPPLKCYVAGTCPASAGGRTTTTPRRSACRGKRRFTIHLDRGLRSARVTVGARRIAVRRRSGRLTAVVDLRGRPKGTVRVTIRGVTRSGRQVTQVRRFRVCTASS